MKSMKTILIAFSYLLLYIVTILATGFAMNLFITNENIRQLIIENSVIMLAVANCIALLAYYMIYKLRGNNLFQFCRFERLTTRTLLTIVPVGLSLGTLIYTFSHLPIITETFPGITDTTEMVGNGGSIIFVILGSVIIGSLAEETLFRGIILNTLKKQFSVPIAILIQALFFGGVMLNLAVGLYAAVGAIIFAVIYLWSGSLWGSLIAHMISTLTMVFYYQLPQPISQSVGTVLIILSIIILAVSLWALKRTQRKLPSAASTYVGL